MAGRKLKDLVWDEDDEDDESPESESDDDEDDDSEEPKEEDVAQMLQNYSLVSGIVEDLQTVRIASTSNGSSQAGPSRGRAVHAGSRSNLQPSKHLKGKQMDEFLRMQSKLKKAAQRDPAEKEKRKDRKERKRREKAEKKKMNPEEFPTVFLSPSHQSALENLIADYRESQRRVVNGKLPPAPLPARPLPDENVPPNETDSNEILDRGDNETEEWREIMETEQAPVPILKMSHDVRMRLDTLSLQYMDEFSRKQRDPAYREMLAFRKKLPAFAAKEDLLRMVNSSQVSVVSGETGCGKTTQLPQFILDDWIERGEGARCTIICTQPRRISAISVSERIARERAESLGISVGYQIRLEKKLPREHCSILMCTTGVLLQWLNSNSYLEGVSHIIVDEIHEQDILSDFLLIILKDLRVVRPDLRIILMSATINAEKFSEYFGGCPLMTIPGFTFPVKEMFLEDILSVTNYKPKPLKGPPKKRDGDAEWDQFCQKLSKSRSKNVMDVLRTFDETMIDFDLICCLVRFIMGQTPKDEAILIFLPGWDDIKKLSGMMNSGFHRDDINLIPLHSMMPTINQRQVFERCIDRRKIVIATSIAETSITIDDIVHVIDCGKIKMKDFDVKRNLSTLTAQWVSMSNARQRRGRAGRVKSGNCYYLYTSFQYGKLDMYPLPEMQRTRLDELCLQVKLLKLGMVGPFVQKAMGPPGPDAVRQAVGLLNMIGALDDAENLTPLGHLLARTPVPPQLGKMMYLGCVFQCINPILNIVAVLGYRDPFCTPLGKEVEAREQRKRFAVLSRSDHILCHDALEDFGRATDKHGFCWDHFMSQPTCVQLQKMKKQFTQILYGAGFLRTNNYMDSHANKNKDDHEIIRTVICGGLYPGLGYMTRTKGSQGATVLTESTEKMTVHPKSYFGRGCTERGIVAFFTVVKTSKVFIHDVTLLHNNLAVVLFCKSLQKFEKDRTVCIGVDGWLNMKCPNHGSDSKKTPRVLQELRDVMADILSYVYANGLLNGVLSPEAQALLDRIAKAITFRTTLGS